MIRRPPKAPVTIVRGDARSLPLADDTVDLVVTSPPYFALRDYTDGGQSLPGQVGAEQTIVEYVDALLEVTTELVRVLKPTGSLWVNLGDKYSGSGGHSQANFVPYHPDVRGENRRRRAPSVYQRGGQDRSVPAKSLMGLPWRYALGCIDKLGLILRAEVIWSKTCAMPESVDDRVRRTHETWFHFTLAERYWCDEQAIRREHQMRPQRRTVAHKAGRRHGVLPPQTYSSSGQRFNIGNDGHPDGALLPSVWDAPTAKQPRNVPQHLLDVAHFAAYPVDLPLRIIAGWCPPDGLVLDPFAGTGTTSVAARALGRRSVAVDLSADYCRLANWRIHASGDVEKARGEQHEPAVVIPGQGDMLEGIL